MQVITSPTGRKPSEPEIQIIAFDEVSRFDIDKWKALKTRTTESHSDVPNILNIDFNAAEKRLLGRESPFYLTECSDGEIALICPICELLKENKTKPEGEENVTDKR